MNRNQVIELLSTIQSLYPNFKVENKTFTVNAWFEMLKDCDYCMIPVSYTHLTLPTN